MLRLTTHQHALRVQRANMSAHLVQLPAQVALGATILRPLVQSCLVQHHVRQDITLRPGLQRQQPVLWDIIHRSQPNQHVQLVPRASTPSILVPFPVLVVLEATILRPLAPH